MAFKILLSGETLGEKDCCVPLTPADMRRLSKRFSITCSVEPSSHRVFSNEAYGQEGAALTQGLETADWVLGFNTINPGCLKTGSWVFLSSIGLKNGWADEAALLDRLQELGCTLIDLERISAADRGRDVGWARFSGIVGMSECLYLLGEKLQRGGVDNPLSRLKPPSAYTSMAELMAHLDLLGDWISEDGLTEQAFPLLISILGGGRSYESGIDAVLEKFPLKIFSPHIVDENIETFSGDSFSLYKIVFKEDDLFVSSDAGFDKLDFLSNPQRYSSRAKWFLPFSTVLINTAFWSAEHAKLLTRDYLKAESVLHSNPLPRVAADLAGRKGGPMEIIEQADFAFGRVQTYVGRRDRFVEGIDASGTTILACHEPWAVFAQEASVDFSARFSVLLAELAAAKDLAGGSEAWIPDWLRSAMIVDHGQLYPERI